VSGVGCETNPATGKTILTLMSRDKEIALGNEAGPQFTEEYGGEVATPELQQYVARIGQKLAAETEAENPALPWKFTLLNSPVVNAFALPGGKVFFSRGLAEQLTSEAQMAGVIGHEVGHVTAQHGNQRISQQLVFNVGLGVTAVVVGASGGDKAKEVAQYGIPALAIGGNLVLLKYGRNQELEADWLGVRYMTNVGYDPRGQLEVMQLLDRLSRGSRPPELLSTHPNPEARVEQIQKLLQTDYAYTQGNPNYKGYADEYKRQFLDVIKALPPPPAPKPTTMLLTEQELARVAGRGFEYDDPTTWCAHCRALPSTSTRGMLAAAVLRTPDQPAH